jgi:hypothetical protein
MTVQIDDVGRQLSHSDLDAFEAWLGKGLPGEYRSFLLRSNGGVPARAVIRIAEQAWSLNEFYGIDIDEPGGDLREVVNDTRNTRPEGYLPIADTDTGEILLLALEGPDSGHVVLWQWQDDYPDWEQHTLYPLADSMAGLLASLVDLQSR